ncbi:MAG: TetR/AcrR family transcriptional regulator C-terminal domain-containing protein [Micromonosporaceae bacterium]
MALTREAIVQTAVKLLRRDGLEALSLRKLAAELNVSAPTLYWHIGSKRELLDLVAEELVRGHRNGPPDRPADGQPWWEWLRDRSREIFDALIATRDAPRVVAGNRPSLQTLPEADRVLGVLIDAGLPPGEAQHALFALGAYIIGSATEWQEEAARAEAGLGFSVELAAAIRSGDYPHLAAAFRELHDQPPRATFEYGLQLMIDGLRARYASE